MRKAIDVKDVQVGDWVQLNPNGYTYLDDGSYWPYPRQDIRLGEWYLISGVDNGLDADIRCNGLDRGCCKLRIIAAERNCINETTINEEPTVNNDKPTKPMTSREIIDFLIKLEEQPDAVIQYINYAEPEDVWEDLGGDRDGFDFLYLHYRIKPQPIVIEKWANYYTHGNDWILRDDEAEAVRMAEVWNDGTMPGVCHVVKLTGTIN